uniref:Uncharacterized protein n=1 Tax=Daucus carota subsp. sativus TaxID=79200 RepID=A0A164ZM73_DAUCS
MRRFQRFQRFRTGYGSILLFDNPYSLRVQQQFVPVSNRTALTRFRAVRNAVRGVPVQPRFRTGYGSILLFDNPYSLRVQQQFVPVSNRTALTRFRAVRNAVRGVPVQPVRPEWPALQGSRLY